MRLFSFATDNFPHFHKKYLCCCGIHYRNAALGIGIFMAILLTLQVYRLFTNDGIYLSIAESLLLVIEIPITVLLFVGIKKNNSWMVLPYVIFSFLVYIFSIISCLTLIVAAIFPELLYNQYMKGALYSVVEQAGVKADLPSDVRGLFRMTFILILLIMSVILFINFCFSRIMLRCYTYIKDYEKYLRSRHQSMEVQTLVKVREDAPTN